VSKASYLDDQHFEQTFKMALEDSEVAVSQSTHLPSQYIS